MAFSQITVTNFLTDDAKRAMDYITEDYIRANVQFLAHDLLEGRVTGSRGELLAATYIATQFKLLGLEPGGDNGSYFQKPRFLSSQSYEHNRSARFNLQLRKCFGN